MDIKNTPLSKEQIEYVQNTVDTFQWTICPELTAKTFLATIKKWSKEHCELTLALLHDYSLETSRLYYECMAHLPAYENPADFVSFKMEGEE